MVCNETHRFIASEQLEAISVPGRSIHEPAGRKTAPDNVAGGRHFFNGGKLIFVGDNCLEDFGCHAPRILATWQTALSLADQTDEFIRPWTEAFLACPGDFIDYGVMENTDISLMQDELGVLLIDLERLV